MSEINSVLESFKHHRKELEGIINSIGDLLRESKISRDEASEILGFSSRTIIQRRLKDPAKWNTTEVEKLLEYIAEKRQLEKKFKG